VGVSAPSVVAIGLDQPRFFEAAPAAGSTQIGKASPSLETGHTQKI
jgi:hypothetical protein